MKPVWREVDGILLLDKPRGLSSNQALQKARRIFGAAKGGHTGSLDPLATGLLPICFGEATKIAGLLLGSRKAYEAECLLGVTTATDDAEAEVVATRPVPELDAATIGAALAGLTGRITQLAPVYSALKQRGVPLYRRVRRGEAVQAPTGPGLTWCNDTRYRVMASIGFEDGKALTTRGWYRIEPGKCLHPDVTGQPRQVFSFAEAVDNDGRTVKLDGKPLNWGGNTMLCSRENQFETNQQRDCEARGFNVTGYAAVDIATDIGRTLRFGMP